MADEAQVPSKPNLDSVLDTVRKWVKSRSQANTHDIQCPVCGNRTWGVGEIVEVRPWEGGALNVGGPIYPLIPIICDTCGLTWFFNAVHIGVLPKAEVSEEAETSEEPR